MDNEKRQALSKYRMEQSEETLKAARMCLDNKLLKDCINRCYYVAFYAVKAVLALRVLILRGIRMQLHILIKPMLHRENFQGK